MRPRITQSSNEIICNFVTGFRVKKQLSVHAEVFVLNTRNWRIPDVFAPWRTPWLSIDFGATNG